MRSYPIEAASEDVATAEAADCCDDRARREWEPKVDLKVEKHQERLREHPGSVTKPNRPEQLGWLLPR